MNDLLDRLCKTFFTLYVLSCPPLVPLDAQARPVHPEASSFGPALQVNLVEGAVLFRTSPFRISGSSFDKDVLRSAPLLEVARERLLDSCRVSRLPLDSLRLQLTSGLCQLDVCSIFTLSWEMLKFWNVSHLLISRSRQDIVVMTERSRAPKTSHLQWINLQFQIKIGGNQVLWQLAEIQCVHWGFSLCHQLWSDYYLITLSGKRLLSAQASAFRSSS